MPSARYVPELVTRRRDTTMRLPELKISTPADAAEAVRRLGGDLAYEHFFTLYLNVRNKVIGYDIATEKNVVGVSIAPQGVVRDALLAGAVAIITVHNHPSGDASPSEHDLVLWKKLREMTKAAGIQLLDNIVVADGEWYSEGAGSVKKNPPHTYQIHAPESVRLNPPVLVRYVGDAQVVLWKEGRTYSGRVETLDGSGWDFSGLGLPSDLEGREDDSTIEKIVEAVVACATNVKWNKDGTAGDIAQATGGGRRKRVSSAPPREWLELSTDPMRNPRKKRGVVHEAPRRADLRKTIRAAHGSVPGVEDRAALRLARAIHASESTSVATSWSAQERAEAFYNEHGLAATLDAAENFERQRLAGAKNPAAEWVLFTKRTDEPKLSWLEKKLTEAGIPHRRRGKSFHAPILEVPEDHLDAAWEILTPVDDVDDDDPMFAYGPNPAGLTPKGERMYGHVKASYAGSPRAKEIAARTVYARAKEGVPGLRKNPNPKYMNPHGSHKFKVGDIVRRTAQAMRSMGAVSGSVNGKVVGYSGRFALIQWSDMDDDEEPMAAADAGLDLDKRAMAQRGTR